MTSVTVRSTDEFHEIDWTGLATIVRRHALPFVILLGGAFLLESDVHAQVELWLTDPGGSARFEKQKIGIVSSNAENRNLTIEIDETKTYQTIDGFGYTLTGGSARHIIHMGATS